jgi:hypothetical protein
MTSIGGNKIVEIFVGCGPFPRCDDDITLLTFGARWFVLGQFSLGNPIGPVAEILVWHAAKLSGDPVRHLLPGLAGLNASLPRFGA